MKKLIILIIFILSSFNLGNAQILSILEKVREIKLPESNRDDVIKILTAYKLEADEENHYDRFSTNDAEIRVDYSEGNCEEFRSDGFEVPEWKAIYIVIEPNNPIKPKNLKINFSKYKKEKKFYDIDDLYVYYDKESGIVFTVNEDKIVRIEFIPPPKYYSLMCDKEKAKKLSVTSSIFEDELKDRNGIPICITANVNELNLSRTEIITSCASSSSKESNNCSEEAKTIDISTIATDPEGDVLTYSYTVSVGKVIGTGEKVIWDLTGVKPGTYTITAAVDDGCGFCGAPKTKSVVVKECANCDKK
jgi:hypothetical protein